MTLTPSSPAGSAPIDLLLVSLEAVLFTAGRPVELAELARVVGADEEQVRDGLAALAEDLATRGVRVQVTDTEAQLASAPEAAAAVERFLGIDGAQKLSGAALETLAIVAYHQPVTRAQIEAIRGVNSDYTLAVLEARGLVREVGRLATAGRPVLWGTTLEFLQYLGIGSLDELPHPEIRHPAQTDMFAALDDPARLDAGEAAETPAALPAPADGPEEDGPPEEGPGDDTPQEPPA